MRRSSTRWQTRTSKREIVLDSAAIARIRKNLAAHSGPPAAPIPRLSVEWAERRIPSE